MAKPLPTLLSADEIRTLAKRAMELLDLYAAQDEDDDDAPLDDSDASDRARRAFHAAKEALRFCGAAAAQVRDPGLTPTLLAMLKALEPWDTHAPDDEDVVAAGLTVCLRAGAPVDKLVERAASDPDPTARSAVAAGLRPNDERSLALLEKLSVDPHPDVRKPAKETLAVAKREVPWWRGKLPSDPALRLSPDELSRLKPTFERLSALLDGPSYELRAKEDELARAIGALPDPLAVEAAQLFLAAGGFVAGRMSKLGAVMLARPGGEDALIALCQSWPSGDRFLHEDAHVAMITALPDPRREEVCLALARWAAAQPHRGRDDFGAPVHIAATLAGKAYPRESDLTPLLDLVLARPTERGPSDQDWFVSGIRDAFVTPGRLPGPIAERVIEAHLAGYPGPWKPIATAMWDLLGRLPKGELRRVAEASTHSENEHVVSWGLERLLHDAHDPERDPEPLEMAGRFLEAPKFRPRMLAVLALRRAVVSHLRAALRRGELRYGDASHAIAIIGDVWGGVLSSSLRFTGTADHDEDDKRAALRAAHPALLGPAELHGPVTEAEWDAFRALRDAQPTWDRRAWGHALGVLPPGPWHPLDRAFVDRAIAACEADTTIVFFLATTLGAKPSARDLPVFARLAALSPDDRGLLRSCYQRVRKAVGDELPAEASAALSGSTAWMDEPEED